MLFCCFWCLRTDMLHLIWFWFWFLRTDTPIYINNYFIFNELVTLSCRINFIELRLILITISYLQVLMFLSSFRFIWSGFARDSDIWGYTCCSVPTILTWCLLITLAFGEHKSDGLYLLLFWVVDFGSFRKDTPIFQKSQLNRCLLRTLAFWEHLDLILPFDVQYMTFCFEQWAMKSAPILGSWFWQFQKRHSYLYHFCKLDMPMMIAKWILILIR
jgi:hypothetical protein